MEACCIIFLSFFLELMLRSIIVILFLVKTEFSVHIPALRNLRLYLYIYLVVAMIHICIVFSEHNISVSNKKEIINFCINLNLCKLLMGNFFMFAINFLT